MILPLLLSCTGAAVDDTAPPTPCACEPEARTLEVDDSGGFDDWAGAALGWAVDEDAGRALVVAARFALPASQIRVEPGCDDGDGWVAGVPPSAEEAVATWPLLAAALTDEPGIHGMDAESGAVLVEGDLASSTPDRLWRATGGGATLIRGEGVDSLMGALEFTGDCDAPVEITGIDLQWPSGGSD
ncbi:MAG: hypothetical protein ACOZNI_25225 [Myxococcota bacterium]